MLLCRVMPGISCTEELLEDQNKSIPGVNFTTGKRYDSCTDDHDDACKQMYVVFSNDQSYPQWLITFTINTEAIKLGTNDTCRSNRKKSTFSFQNTDLNNFNSHIDLRDDGETDLNLSQMHKLRFYVLFLSIMMNFGSYYCYDLPNALSDLITGKLTHETEKLILYNQLYSIISLPNVFLPFIGSFLIKRYGINITMVSLNLCVLIGQIIFSISGYLVNDNQNDYFQFYVALFGRFIYGLGGEILNVCQITILSIYFKHKELAFALGMYFSCTGFAECLCNYIAPLVSSSTSLGFALSSSSITCVISVVLTFVFIYIDNSISDSSHKIEDDEESEEFNCKDVTELPKSFWLIMINCSFIFTGMLFYNISNEFFSTRYGFNQIEAAKFSANSGLMFIIMTPIFGIFTDKIGHRVSFVIINWMDKNERFYF